MFILVQEVLIGSHNVADTHQAFGLGMPLLGLDSFTFYRLRYLRNHCFHRNSNNYDYVCRLQPLRQMTAVDGIYNIFWFSSCSYARYQLCLLSI